MAADQKSSKAGGRVGGGTPTHEKVHFYYDKVLLKKLTHSADKINSYFTSDTADKSLYGMLD